MEVKKNLYKKGEFKEYVAESPIYIGAHEIKIEEGDEIETDGYVLKYGGEDYPTPSIRGAIDRGYFVLKGNEVGGGFAPRRAITSLSRMNPDGSREEVPLEAVVEDHDTVASFKGREVRSAKSKVEAGDYVPVRGLNTPTKYTFDVTANEEVQEISSEGRRMAFVQESGGPAVRKRSERLIAGVDGFVPERSDSSESISSTGPVVAKIPSARSSSFRDDPDYQEFQEFLAFKAFKEGQARAEGKVEGGKKRGRKPKAQEDL